MEMTLKETLKQHVRGKSLFLMPLTATFGFATFPCSRKPLVIFSEVANVTQLLHTDSRTSLRVPVLLTK